MLRRATAALGVAVVLLLVPTSALAGGYGEPPASEPAAPSPDASAGSSGSTLTVTVSQEGTTSSGRTFTSTPRAATIQPMCWYERGDTGYEYYEYWKPGGPARESQTLADYAYQGLLHADYESHATDKEGYWYEPRCRYDLPAGYADNYYRTHPAVWVPAGQPAPVIEAVVDPAVLAQIAEDSIELPQGTIRWNPTLEGSGATVVNMDTWVWVEDAPTTVTVRASIPGTWAEVRAELSGLELSAPGADPQTCPDTGTPWTSGATSTTCSITFFRSTANQPVKSGQSLPTATLTATATWTASWTSSIDPNPTALAAQTLATTAEVPVAEVQTLVTGRG